VLEQAAEKFDWKQRRAALAAAPEANAAANAASSGATGSTSPTSLRGIGLACATEKGSFVAACVELAVDVASGRYRVTEICEAFECGAILNPGNLRLQVEGCIVQGLGGALREEIRFRDGVVENARFSQYLVPRFRDVPPITCVLLDRPDLPSAGAGETPIVAVAPAIANALAMATGTRIRSMPIRDGKLGAE
jgi:isoquinoline 1-oxidoreductase